MAIAVGMMAALMETQLLSIAASQKQIVLELDQRDVHWWHRHNGAFVDQEEPWMVVQYLKAYVGSVPERSTLNLK